MEGWNEFLNWAYERHQNVLSWYIRPLFLIPLAWFSWRRSFWGILGTLLALLSSMFWFSRPDQVDPRVLEFLRMEREYLLEPLTPLRALWGSLVPLSLCAYCLAFWRRSILLGLALLNGMAVAKLIWSLQYGGSTGWVILPFAVIGLGAGNAAILWFTRRSLPGADRRDILPRE